MNLSTESSLDVARERFEGGSARLVISARMRRFWCLCVWFSFVAAAGDFFGVASVFEESSSGATWGVCGAAGVAGASAPPLLRPGAGGTVTRRVAPLCP
jgi:hypothetical protein